jgi:methylase of polypeptide subunit release factors
MGATMNRRLAWLAMGLLFPQVPNAVNAADGAVKSSPAAESAAASKSKSPLESTEVRVQILEETLTLFPGVFSPKIEADRDVLPFMKAHRFLFEGKRVLEIGTGSGVISLYAAKLGASAVIATDINPKAVDCARFNTKKLGYDDVMEVRLVSESDSAAFAVIDDDERFDIIISNPPYALVLDEMVGVGREAADHRGDLGTSIIEGLNQYLNPGGMAALLYQSLFYQQVMIKYAEKRGFDVTYHLTYWFAPWEMDALFKTYAEKFLKYRGLPDDFISFDFREDSWGQARIRVAAKEYPPLIREGIQGRYPGFIIIKRKQ